MDDFTSNSVAEFLIEAVGITKVYKHFNNMHTACSDISFKISSDDFIIIFGSGSSGKTTLLSIIYGIEKPDIGEVLLKGEPLYEFSEDERSFIRARKFGFIPHGFNWIDRFTLLDNVALPLFIIGHKEQEARQIAYETLRYFGIERQYQLKPNAVKFFDQQLASLARAIVNQPWIIFADEPYKNLDDDSANKIFSYLKKINEEKKIAVVVSTSQPELLKYSNKWLFIDKGRIENIKTNKNLLKRLKEVIIFVEKEEEALKKSEKKYSI